MSLAQGVFMMKSIIGIVFLGITCSMCQAALSDPRTIVTEFFIAAFVDRQPEEAAARYVSPDKYIQHNPNGKNGRESFINGFAQYVESTAYRCEIKRVVAEGDLVVVHSHCKEKPDDRGSAVIDIFRVEKDLIVEHWDVMQAIPEAPKNPNTMF
jgi:predicted SnoaL-like aldol condensation-catalyzing enzyme